MFTRMTTSMSHLAPDKEEEEPDKGSFPCHSDHLNLHDPRTYFRKRRKTKDMPNSRLLRTFLPLSNLLLLLLTLPCLCAGNNLPQFLLPPGQSEIVLRLKEGPATPVGSLVHTLKGVDKDGDPLVFGLKGHVANELFRVEKNGRDSARLYLKKELDREVRGYISASNPFISFSQVEAEYMLLVTLSDGKVSEPVAQSLLLLVEDVNDNAPAWKPFASTLRVPENGGVPGVLATLEATDADEGPYGQVIYRLQVEEGDEGLFGLSTTGGAAVLRLLKPLDYERKILHQIRLVAEDRAETQDQINKAVASIVIQVTDEEDMGPTFVSVPPVTQIREDLPVNSIVLQVRAVDGDRGINNPIKYSLANSRENEDAFEIDPDTGIVITRTPLDREGPKGGSYVLRLVATEQSRLNPKPSAETTVVVNLLDIDDEVPRFKSPFYLGEISENSQEGVPVSLLGNSLPEVFDHDLGINGTFALRTEGDGGVFEVTPSSGINAVSFLLRVKNPARLDFEAVKELNFSLVAEGASKASSVPVSVRVLDVNDNFPQFERGPYEVTINENAPIGASLLRVKATDKDSGMFGTGGIRYTGLSGSLAKDLSFDPVSGLISVRNSSLLDRELSPVYYLSVEAQDNLGRGNRNSVQITVHLRDENDNEPIFLQSKYEARIFENEMEFVSPVQVQATDNDLKDTPNSQVSYNLISSTPQISEEEELWIEVDPTSGRIRIVKPFDFESLDLIPSHSDASAPNVKILNFTIRATDGGIPSRLSTAQLILYVFDVNDNAPVFTRDYMSRIVREDLVAGNQVGRVEATDGDASAPFNAVFYRIEEGGQDKWVIESETGIIRLAPGASLDFNLKQFHILEVSAIDGGGKLSEEPCIVNITLKDINNKKPKFEFGQIEDGSGANSGQLYLASVVENSPMGTFITQVKASDPDTSSVLRYSIDFNKSESRNEDGRVLAGKQLDMSKLFVIDPVDGVLSVVGLLDREIVEKVKLHLLVQDIASETGEQRTWASLFLEVLDENDNDPKFRQSPYYATVQENTPEGSKILTVTADDPDEDRVITYAIYRSESNRKFPLAIDPETGVIEVVSKIDRESTQWVNMTVIAEDSGVKKRQSTVTVVLKVVDKNDNVPTFVDNISNVTVPEDTAVGSVIGKVVARDSDAGNYGKVTYLLDRKSSAGKFTVDSETGQIRVAEPLDREEQSTYTLVLQAWDNFQFGYASGESRNAFKQITVSVSDINDCAPEFVVDDSNEVLASKLSNRALHVAACTSITEFHEELVMTIRARDRDDGNTPNGRVSFRIKSGNELGLFKLVPGTNIAKVLPARSLKGFYGNYTLSIEVVDGGKSQNRVTKDFNICVQDFNDNKPRFINPSQNSTVRVPENATVGSSIIQVRAIDSDIGQNGVVRYRFRQEFSRHWETFGIHPTTGVLSLAKQLDREKQKVYYLRIEAYDLGTPTPLSSELDLSILVQNVDDFKPIFTLPFYETAFTENINPGREKVTLPTTIDKDDDEDEEKEKAAVCYFIVHDTFNSSNLFELDPLTHVLSTRVRLDREKAPVHNFTVFATDACHLDLSRIPIASLDPGSLLKVSVTVLDVNDNAPRFTQKVFTGGVSTSSDYGTEVLTLSATDKDAPANAQLTYCLIPPVIMALSEGLSHLITNSAPLFTVDPSSGVVSLGFDPQPDMKGHFTLSVLVNDTTGLKDSAKALIYLLRDDQKVTVTVRMSPAEVRQNIQTFRATLGNVTGVVVNADAGVKVAENRDGSVDRTKTEFQVHFVHPKEAVVLEAVEALALMDANIEALDDLFKEFNVLDTRKASITLVGANVVGDLTSKARGLFLVYAIGSALFLTLILLVVVSICFAQRAKYQRQLKAATTNAYGSNSTMLPSRTGTLPNTNVHRTEGSNPIWMQAYHNTWYKEDHSSLSGNSEARDSLDEETGVRTESTSPPSSHMHSFLGSTPIHIHTHKRGAPPLGKEAMSTTTTRRNDLNRNKEKETYHRNLIYGNRVEGSSSNGSGGVFILNKNKKPLEATEL